MPAVLLCNKLQLVSASCRHRIPIVLLACLHAIVMSPDEYRVKIRKTNEVPFPEWKENAQYLLAEMDMAGAIHGIKSTAVLRAAQ